MIIVCILLLQSRHFKYSNSGNRRVTKLNFSFSQEKYIYRITTTNISRIDYYATLDSLVIRRLENKWIKVLKKKGREIEDRIIAIGNSSWKLFLRAFYASKCQRALR